MRIKDHIDMVRHLTDPFNIPEARRMIQENPALTQEQFKAGGIVEPGVTHYARKSPTKINEELFTKIDDLIADAEKAGKVLDKKALGEGLGYKVVKKGKTSGQGGLNKVIEAWEESRDTVFEYKPSKLTLDSPQVQEVLKLQEEGMSTRQITKELDYKDEKAVRNIFKQFRPEAIKEPNVPGEITSAKQSKIMAAKNIKIAEKKAGPTTTKQAKDVKSQILEYNNPYKKMSPVELAKDKEFLKRLRVHIDINTGEVTYDGYTKTRPRKGKVFSDLELAEHAIKKANQGQLFTDDHITPKSLQKQNVGYPRNLQPVTYIENSEFDNARKYVINNPNGNTSAMDKYLTKNNQTLRFPDQKIKLGVQEVIEYSPKTGSQTLVKKDFLKQSIASQIRTMDGETISAYKDVYPDCFKSQGGKNAIACLSKQAEKNQEKFVKNSVNIAKATEGTKTSGQMINFLKKFRRVGKLTGWLAVGEAAFAPLMGIPMWAQGTPKDEIAHTLTYGLFGTKHEDKLLGRMSDLGKTIYKTTALEAESMRFQKALESAPETGYEKLRINQRLKELAKEYEEAAKIFINPDTGEYNQNLVDQGYQEVEEATTYLSDIKTQNVKDRAAWMAPKVSSVMEKVVDKPGKAFIDFTLGPNWKENLPEQQNQFYKKRYPRNPRELGQHLSYDPDIPMFAEGGIADLLKK